MPHSKQNFARFNRVFASTAVVEVALHTPHPHTPVADLILSNMIPKIDDIMNNS